jgi:hypothetical protein
LAAGDRAWAGNTGSGGRALAAALGDVVQLPPIKRSLAAGLLKSRYVAAVLDRIST